MTLSELLRPLLTEAALRNIERCDGGMFSFDSEQDIVVCNGCGTFALSAKLLNSHTVEELVPMIDHAPCFGEFWE